MTNQLTPLPLGPARQLKVRFRDKAKSRRLLETAGSERCHLHLSHQMTQSLRVACKPLLFSPAPRTTLTCFPIPQTTTFTCVRLSHLKPACAQSRRRTSALALPHERPRPRRLFRKRLQTDTNHIRGDEDLHEARRGIRSQWRSHWRRWHRKGSTVPTPERRHTGRAAVRQAR